MKNLIIERIIGDDLALINANNQTVCILDETGKQIWQLYKRHNDLNKLKKQVEVPDESKEDFNDFCNTLVNFLTGKETSINNGVSLHSYFYDANKPLVIGLEINNDCMLFCKHCYNHKRKYIGYANANDLPIYLPLSSIKKIAEDLANLGTPFCIITGGEPLLHPNFLEICQILTDSGIALKIFTNGYNMTPQIADALANMHTFLIGFTLFGANANDHEYITEVPGSFNRIVNAINLVKQRNIPCDVTFFLMKHNFPIRDEMKLWSINELGLYPSFSFSLTPRETGEIDVFDLEISKEQIHTFFLEQGIARESLQCGDESMVPCTAGKTLLAIKANGNVTPCVSLNYTVGNVNTSSLKEIWINSSRLKLFRNLQRENIDGCANCELSNICLRCFVNAQILGNNTFGKDKHACMVTHILQNTQKTLQGKEQ